MASNKIVMLDIVMMGFVIGFLLTATDYPTKARMYWHTANVCRGIAASFGRMAILAELGYFAEVQS